MIRHPWHAISCGSQAPTLLNAIVEIPRGSRAKYELDLETGFLRLDRILTTSISYPFHYGFVPQTYADDGDPVDILILCSEPLVPLVLVETRVLGIMHMLDQQKKDHKIIAVATGDHSMRHIHELVDLPSGTLEDMRCFFSNYKRAENKEVIVEDFSGKEPAYHLITESMMAYKQKFNP
jgi:inorganic pyrophosphatase